MYSEEENIQASLDPRNCLLYTCKQLAEIERKCGIPKRWSRTDQKYIDTRKSIFLEKLKQLHGCLWASVVKRFYLLQMKAKYAGVLDMLYTKSLREAAIFCLKETVSFISMSEGLFLS